MKEEKVLGQKFVVDVTMSVCLRAAAASDDLVDTVNYAAAFDLVKSEVEGQSRDLIECLSGRIAAGILREFPTARLHTGSPIQLQV